MLLEGLVGERDVGAAQRHGSGDDVAFGQLYETYYPRLLRYCRRRVRDSFTAEEIAQDAFMRAYAAYARLDSADRFYPWLTVIAKRLIIDHYRRSGRTVATPDLDPGEVDAAESAIMRRVEYEEVWQALDRVRLRHQEVLRLRDVEGLSYDAIAERLGTPATTVPPLLHRARQALRREYFALTEPERAHAAPSAALAAWLLVRRTRDRIMQCCATLPDASVMAAPAAAVVFSMASLVVAAGQHGASEAQASWPPQPVSFSNAANSMDRAASVDATDVSKASDQGSDGYKAVEAVSLNEDKWEERRAGARDFPVYIENEETGTWFGADPDAMRRDAESTLAGDLSWMEVE